MKFINRLFRSFTMTSQITIYNCIILATIISILIIIFSCHSNLLLPLSNEIQREMAFKNNKNLLDSMLASYNRLITTFIQISNKYIVQDANELIAMHQLLLAWNSSIQSQNLKYDFSGIHAFPKSLEFPSQITKQPSTYSFMCGSNKTEILQNNQSQSGFIDFSNKLGELGPMLNTEILGIGSLIYGGIYTDPVMFYTYPCLHLGSIFERYPVTKRPWYTKALLEYSKSHHQEYSLKFTDPYVYANTVGTIDVSLVLPQINHQKEFIGAWAIDLQGSMFVKYLQQDNSIDMILLVAESGILLVHNFENKDQIIPLYFQNETTTGFTEQDWNSIKTNNLSENNCDPQYQIVGVICKVNIRMSKEFHIFATHVKQYDLFVVILYDLTPIRHQIEGQTIFIRNFMHSTLVQIMIYLAIIFSIATVLFMITIRLAVVKPITEVTSLFQKTLQPHEQRSLFSFTIMLKTYNSSQVQNLLTQFNLLLSKIDMSKLTKNQQCQQLQDEPEFGNRIIFWKWKGAICQLLQNKPQFYTPNMWLKTLMNRKNQH